MRSSESSASYNAPQWQFQSTQESTTSSGKRCNIRFDIPADLQPPVFLYYRLTSFYQNHRRYVKSLDSDQLKGTAVSASTLNGGDCKPLAILDGKIVWPCGLIANSMFNGMSIFLRSVPFTHRTAGNRHVLERYSIEPFANLQFQLEKHRLAGRGSQVCRETGLRGPQPDCASAKLDEAIPTRLHSGQPAQPPHR